MLLGAAPLITIQSAPAAPLLAQHALGKIETSVETVQYRNQGHDGGLRHGRHGYRGNGDHGRYGRYEGGYYRNGPAVLSGLAAGAIIGGAIANSQTSANRHGYCSERYRSYDSASGTYLGYDGQRHFCP